MDCSDLIFTDLKITEGFAHSISAKTTASCTLRFKPGYEDNEVEIPETGLDIYFQDAKIGSVMLPAQTLREGPYTKEFDWTYAPDIVGGEGTELLTNYYTSTGDQKITFKLSVPSALPQSILSKISFNDFYLRGKAHDMITKAIVHVGPHVIFKEVRMDLLVEKPVDCNLEILSLTAEAKTGDGRLLAKAKHDFSPSGQFLITGSAPESSPSKAITAHLAMSHLQCIKFMKTKNPVVTVFVTSGTMKLDDYKLENVKFTHENVPFEVRLLGWNVTRFKPFRS